MTTSLPPAGWYPDPADPTRLRWWNGAAWTDQTTPIQDSAGQGATAEQTNSEASVDGAEAHVDATANATSVGDSTSDPGVASSNEPVNVAGADADALAGTAAAAQAQPQPTRSYDAAAETAAPIGVLVTTTDAVPGYTVVAVHGAVLGVTVRARTMFSSMSASFKTAFGGEVPEYSSLLQAAREEAIERAKQRCRDLGGNAVVGMRFDSIEVGDLINEVTAYGTAVTLVADPPTT